MPASIFKNAVDTFSAIYQLHLVRFVVRDNSTSQFLRGKTLIHIETPAKAPYTWRACSFSILAPFANDFFVQSNGARKQAGGKNPLVLTAEGAARDG